MLERRKMNDKRMAIWTYGNEIVFAAFVPAVVRGALRDEICGRISQRSPEKTTAGMQKNSVLFSTPGRVSRVIMKIDPLALPRLPPTENMAMLRPLSVSALTK